MTRTRTRGLLEVLAAVGVAAWIERLVTLEWSYAYCSVRDSGEAAAVYGFPLPHEQIFIAGSASANFIPWLYLIDLALISGGVLVLLRLLSSGPGLSKPRLWNLAIGAVAALLLVPVVALDLFAISIGVWSPTSSFSDNLQYTELRPVKVHIAGRPRNCTPSPFWFPDQGARNISTSKR